MSKAKQKTNTPAEHKPSDCSERAALERLEYVIDVLRTRVVKDGWSIDETAAKRTLNYYRLRADGSPEHDIEEALSRAFIFDHGQSLDWIWMGDPVGMICKAASGSVRARRVGPNADPYDNLKDTLSELEPTIHEAHSLAVATRMLASSGEMPEAAGAALDAVASDLIRRLDDIRTTRHQLWALMCGSPLLEGFDDEGKPQLKAVA